MSQDMHDHGVDHLINNLKHLSAVSSESFDQPRKRLFGRQRPVHQLLGGSRVADVLFWRKKHISAVVLIGATIIWILFEWIQCHFVSVASLFLLSSVIILFLWSNLSAFLHRPPPPLPLLQLSDELALNVASILKEEINTTLFALHIIALGKDFRLFLKVIIGLWILSVIGGWFHFLTLIYIAMLASLTLPVVYEKYEDYIEDYVEKALRELQKQYEIFDAKYLSRIPRVPTKEKKSD